MKKVLAIFLFILGLALGLYIAEYTDKDPEAFYGLIIGPIFTIIIWIMAYGLVKKDSTRDQR